MVKRTITITTILLIISIAISLIIVLNKSSFAADDDIASGTYSGVSWRLTSSNRLILGDGNEQTLNTTTNGPLNPTSWPWNNYRTQIQSIEFDGIVHCVKNLDSIFAGCISLTSVNLEGLDISNVTSLESMFFSCSSLVEIDLTGLDTSNVENMRGMFRKCSKLETCNISGIDTSKVKDFSGTFAECTMLTNIDVSNLDTSNAISLGGSCRASMNGFNSAGMFENCQNLTELDVSGWNVSNVEELRYAFCGCSKITFLDVSNWNTSNAKTMSRLFMGCSSLTSLDVSGFITNKVSSMERMFTNCSNLTEIDVSGFNTNNVNNMSHLFAGCQKVEYLEVDSWNVSKVTNLDAMFYNCSSLATLNVSNWDVSKNKTLDITFAGCSKLTTLDVSRWNTSSLEVMPDVFSNCSMVTELEVSNWDVSNVTRMDGAFKNCSSLTNLDLTKWDTSSAENMSEMFMGCTGFSSIDVSTFNTSKVTDMSYMFHGSKIKILDLSNFDTSQVTNWYCMFYANRLEELNISSFSTESLVVKNNSDECFRNYWAKKVVLGENFSFTKNNTMNGPSDVHYTGKWIRDDETFGPYTPDELHDNYDGTTMAGTWIWEKASYTVSYSYTGTVPNGASELPLNTKYKVETQVAVASDSAAPGYTFSGWSKTGTFEMPAEDVTITGSFIPNTDTPYKVEHYLEDITENNYTLTKTDNLTGTTDTEVEATAKEYEGLTFDNTIEGTKQSGNIAGDGSLVLKIYYKRNSYNVTYAYTGDVPDGASELPQSKTYKYGEEIKVPENSTADGYTFSGWIKDYITMPARDIVITGYFIEEPRLYKIEYYFDNELDEALVEILNAEKNEEINLTPQTPVKHGEKNYTLVSNNHNIVVSVNDEDNIIRVYYETDVLDYAIDNFEDTTEGDGIPDKYQIRITYKVENGSWDDGTTNTKTDIITLKDKDGNLSEEGTGTTTIPEVGNKPSEEYEVGSWNEEIPSQVSREDNGKEFVYSYKMVEKAENVKPEEKKTDISEATGKIYNPKTDDMMQNYLLVGVGGILVLAVVRKIRRKYSRKAKKIQF